MAHISGTSVGVSLLQRPAGRSGFHVERVEENKAVSLMWERGREGGEEKRKERGEERRKGDKCSKSTSPCKVLSPSSRAPPSIDSPLLNTPFTCEPDEISDSITAPKPHF